MSIHSAAQVQRTYEGLVWRKDEDARCCMQCHVPFTFFKRRHHCRMCGDIFCDVCSSSRVRLEEYSTLQRVCDSCFEIRSQELEEIGQCGPKTCLPGRIADKRTDLRTTSVESLIVPIIRPLPRNQKTLKKHPEKDTDQLQARRNKICRELIETEITYVKDLLSLINNFLQPIKQRQYLPKSSRAKLSALLSSVSSIAFLHSNMLKDMQGEEPKNFVKILGDYIDYMNMYTQYVQHVPLLWKDFTPQEPGPLSLGLPLLTDKLQNFLQSTSEDYGLQDITQLLILPIQRIPRYLLLLDNLHKSTPLNHNSMPILLDVIGHIRSVANRVDECFQDSDNAAALLELHSSIKCSNDLRIMSPTRKLLKRGVFSFISDPRHPPIQSTAAHPHPRSVRVVLFNHMLVVTDYNFKYLTSWELPSIEVSTHHQTMIHILAHRYGETTSEVLGTFGCSDKKERDQWIDILKKAIHDQQNRINELHKRARRKTTITTEEINSKTKIMSHGRNRSAVEGIKSGIHMNANKNLKEKKEEGEKLEKIKKSKESSAPPNEEWMEAMAEQREKFRTITVSRQQFAATFLRKELIRLIEAINTHGYVTPKSGLMSIEKGRLMKSETGCLISDPHSAILTAIRLKIISCDLCDADPMNSNSLLILQPKNSNLDKYTDSDILGTEIQQQSASSSIKYINHVRSNPPQKQPPKLHLRMTHTPSTTVNNKLQNCYICHIQIKKEDDMIRPPGVGKKIVHFKCFVCKTCHINLEISTFAYRNGKFFCPLHSRELAEKQANAILNKSREKAQEKAEKILEQKRLEARDKAVNAYLSKTLGSSKAKNSENISAYLSATLRKQKTSSKQKNISHNHNNNKDNTSSSIEKRKTFQKMTKDMNDEQKEISERLLRDADIHERLSNLEQKLSSAHEGDDIIIEELNSHSKTQTQYNNNDDIPHLSQLKNEEEQLQLIIDAQNRAEQEMSAIIADTNQQIEEESKNLLLIANQQAEIDI